MTIPDIDVLAIDGGSVTAPAGCGKTELIARAVTGNSSRKPILILTHTNAGVAALRARLKRAGATPKAYRLFTIDGWAIRLVSTFPRGSCLDPHEVGLQSKRPDYERIRQGATALLSAGHIHDILAASYSRLIVDEYQDCSRRQHAIVKHAASALRTCVLGDPMQAIFNFGEEPLANWEEDVCTCFPKAGELIKPWRWINADSEPLGEWLLHVRKVLQSTGIVDLQTAPRQVRWVSLTGSNSDYQKRLAAGRTRLVGGEGNTLIICDGSKTASQRQFASRIPGAVLVEAVDLGDLVSFAEKFSLTGNASLGMLIKFAQGVMTNVGAQDFLSRVDSLGRGSARKPPTDAERAALTFLQHRTYALAIDLLMSIRRSERVRLYRPTLLWSCIKALRICSDDAAKSLLEAAVLIREQSRLEGRRLPPRAVGSTLLLKGLEAEVVVVLDASQLSARNLYVALTRGSKLVVVCAHTVALSPQRDEAPHI